MDEQLRPAQAQEHDLLARVIAAASQAQIEYAARNTIAARLEVTKAIRLLSAVMNGEAV